MIIQKDLGGNIVSREHDSLQLVMETRDPPSSPWWRLTRHVEELHFTAGAPLIIIIVIQRDGRLQRADISFIFPLKADKKQSSWQGFVSPHY